LLPALLIMIFIGVSQGLPLIRNKQYRELTGFALVWFAATVFFTLVTSQVYLPSLVEVLESIYSFIGLLD